MKGEPIKAFNKRVGFSPTRLIARQPEMKQVAILFGAVFKKSEIAVGYWKCTGHL